MRTSSHFARLGVLVATSAFVSLAGCAGDDETVSGSSDALISGPVSPAQCASFEKKHPTTSVTLSTGVDVGVPFVSCDVNTAAVFGTIDLAVAQQLIEGTGYVPLQVVQNGQPPKGLARLYFANYLTTEIGSYNEFMLLIDATSPDADAASKTLRVVNPISTLLPAFNPQSRALAYRLILQKEAVMPIAYGRELLGLDKRAGTVDLVQFPKYGMSFAVADETGAPVVRGAFHPDGSFVALGKAMAELVAAAVGEPIGLKDIAMKLHPLQLNQPIEASATVVSRDPLHAGRMAAMSSTNQWLPTMSDVNDKNFEIEIDSSSELGKLLNDAHFTPTSIAAAAHSNLLVAPE